MNHSLAKINEIMRRNARKANQLTRRMISSKNMKGVNEVRRRMNRISSRLSKIMS